MKQTAVEWYAEEFAEHLEEMYNIKITSLTLLSKAKAMEKQQIIDAYENGDSNGANRVYYHSDKDDKSAEQYYNETLKINK